nr:hypothetical protein BaRGS_025465 [Batillaria attramentaria]
MKCSCAARAASFSSCCTSLSMATVIIMVAMTVERYLIIRFPLKAVSWSTPKRACKVVTVVFLLTALLESHHLVIRDMVWNDYLQVELCVPVGELGQYYVSRVWPWVDGGNLLFRVPSTTWSVPFINNLGYTNHAVNFLLYNLSSFFFSLFLALGFQVGVFLREQNLEGRDEARQERQLSQAHLAFSRTNQ